MIAALGTAPTAAGYLVLGLFWGWVLVSALRAPRRPYRNRRQK